MSTDYAKLMNDLDALGKTVLSMLDEYYPDWVTAKASTGIENALVLISAILKTMSTPSSEAIQKDMQNLFDEHISSTRVANMVYGLAKLAEDAS